MPDIDIGDFFYLVVLIGGLIATVFQQERSKKKAQERRRAAPPSRPAPPSPFDEPALDRRFEGAASPRPRPQPIVAPKPKPATSKPKPPPKPRAPQPEASRLRRAGETFAEHLERGDRTRQRGEDARDERFLITSFKAAAPSLAPDHTLRKGKRTRHKRALRKLLTDRNELRDLILLAEILAPPASERVNILGKR